MNGKENLFQCFLNTCEADEIGKAKALSSSFNPGIVPKEIQQANIQRIEKLLHKAASFGHIQILLLLIEIGSNVNIRGFNNQTLLHEACVHGHPQIVSALLAAKVNPLALDKSGRTALHTASFNGELKCVSHLLDNELCVDAITTRDQSGCLPHHLAVINDHAIVLCELLRHTRLCFADIQTAENMSLLHYAAYHGSIKCISFIRSHNCDLEDLLQKQTNKGWLPSHCSVINDHVNCLHEIIMIMDDYELDTATHSLLQLSASRGSLKCLHWLLNNYVSTITKDGNGNSAFHLAAANGCSKCINCLVSHNMNTDQLNKRGVSALTVAREHGHPVAYEKAISGEVRCPYCVENEAESEYNRIHQPSDVENSINNQSKLIFNSSDLKNLHNWKKTTKKTKSTPTSEKTRLHASSSLAAKYYAEQLLRFSDVISGTEKLQSG